MTTGEWWAYGSALVVLLGVVGETVADLTEWIKPETRKKRIEKISALVLILGLTGDVLSIRKTQLATAFLNKEAEDARRDAAAANEAAKGFEREIAKSDERAAEAEKQADQAKLDLETYKAPRKLTQEQKDRITGALRAFSGQTFSLNVDGDPEAVAFLQVIRTVLNSAGWVEIPSQIGDITIGGAGMVTETGVKVEVAAGAELKYVEIVKRLSDVLNDVGVITIPRHNPQLKDLSAINVSVGKKL